MQRVLLFFLPFFSLIIGLGFPPNTLAHHANSCPDKPAERVVPIEITPKDGAKASDEFTLTVDWESGSELYDQLDSALYSHLLLQIYYNDQLIQHTLYQGGYQFPSQKVKDSVTFLLSEFTVPGGEAQQLRAYLLDIDASCHFEQGHAVFTVSSTTDNETGEPEPVSREAGDQCNIDSVQAGLESCPAEFPCEKAEAWDIYRCGGDARQTNPNPPLGPACKQFGADGSCELVDTSIPGFEGGFRTDVQGFVQDIFGVLLSLAGGVALLLIIYSGYKMMTSRGNPEAIQAARDRITSAIVGLLFIIFSMTILEFIGIDIIRVPQFERDPSIDQNDPGENR